MRAIVPAMKNVPIDFQQPTEFHIHGVEVCTVIRLKTIRPLTACSCLREFERARASEQSDDGELRRVGRSIWDMQ